MWDGDSHFLKTGVAVLTKIVNLKLLCRLLQEVFMLDDAVGIRRDMIACGFDVYVSLNA